VVAPRGGAILVVENAIFIVWPLKWRHQVAKINISFIQTTKFPDIFNILGVVRFWNLCRSKCRFLGQIPFFDRFFCPKKNSRFDFFLSKIIFRQNFDNIFIFLEFFYRPIDGIVHQLLEFQQEWYATQNDIIKIEGSANISCALHLATYRVWNFPFLRAEWRRFLGRRFMYVSGKIFQKNIWPMGYYGAWGRKNRMIFNSDFWKNSF